MSMDRRRFLGLAGGAAVVTAGGVGVWEGLLRDHLADRDAAPRPDTGPSSDPGDHVLVVLQLTGGNDGLNTLVPLDGRYHDARPTLGIADHDLLDLEGEPGFGLAPKLEPLAALWRSGRLAAVDGVGFERSSHSHFQALDWWWSAQPGTTATTGWLGRWLDATAEGGAASNPLRAIAVGGAAPMLRSRQAPATVINDPTRFALAAPPGVDAEGLVAAFAAAGAPAGADPGSLEAQARRAMLQVTDSVDRLAPAGLGAAAGRARATAAVGGGSGSVAEGLDLAARLIGLDLGTRVVAVGGGTFDTHAGEAAEHEALRADLGAGLGSFFEALDRSGHADRVRVVTTSEFGRRVQENGSGGTDHGAGGVQFVAGAGVPRRVVGTPDLGHLTAAGDVAPAIDARSLYAVGLDWLGGPTDDVLGGSYDTFGLTAT